MNELLDQGLELDQSLMIKSLSYESTFTLVRVIKSCWKGAQSNPDTW